MYDDILSLSATAQSALIRSGELSPVDLVTASLAQIDRYDGILRAFISVDGERALAAARSAEADIAGGRWRGPLHGLPYGVKDQIHAVGFPTTLGTRVLDEAEMVPPSSATVIERLDAAGAILIGKQNLHEFGKGGTLDFPYGQPRNPWNTAYNASSSSTGSGIAAAASMVSFSLGEDTGGSIRGPAALNGIVGLRPTYGRVSRHGGVMHAYTSDTIGPLARTVEDLAHVLQAIAGHDPRDPLSARREVPDYAAALTGDVAGVRIGVVHEIANAERISPEVRATFEAALDVLRGLGAIVDEVSLPLARYAVPLQMMTADVDVASFFAARYLPTRYDRFDVGTRTRLAAAAIVPGALYSRAMRARVLLRREVLAAFRSVDVLASPTMLTPTKRIDASQETVSGDEADAVDRLMERRIGLYPFSIANVPAIALPMGLADNGLPLSIQFAGRPFQEADILRVAHTYEQSTPWHATHPDLENVLANAA